MKKKVLVALLIFLLSNSVFSQAIVSPGMSTIKYKGINNGHFLMGYYAMIEGQLKEIGHFSIDIGLNGKSLSVITALKFLGSTEQWIDSSISDANSFRPIYRSSTSSSRDFHIRFGSEITGSYFDKKTSKRYPINEKAKGDYFESYSYPYILGLLPLSLGYRAELPVYDFKIGAGSNVKRARIEEVKNNVYKSKLTGEHKVWQVSVFEESTNDKYEYYIDKETRRIWMIEVLAKDQRILLLDKEVDFNPYTTKFDKEATMKMIKSGNSVISGQVFARDNQAKIKGIAILNVNKKQHAQKGTSIVLIPYTPFFKEWINLNKASRKKGISIPLPQEVLDCMKTTTVYDEQGHFDFVNLMPGDYLLYTEFGYVHTATHTEVIGYTDTYINGMFQGSTANTETYSYNTNASAAVQKIVTINKDGEKLTVKLKKTL